MGERRQKRGRRVKVIRSGRGKKEGADLALNGKATEGKAAAAPVADAFVARVRNRSINRRERRRVGRQKKVTTGSPCPVVFSFAMPVLQGANRLTLLHKIRAADGPRGTCCGPLCWTAVVTNSSRKKKRLYGSISCVVLITDRNDLADCTFLCPAAYRRFTGSVRLESDNWIGRETRSCAYYASVYNYSVSPSQRLNRDDGAAGR